MTELLDAPNQPPELLDYNLFTSHPVLVEALAREGAGSAHEERRNAILRQTHGGKKAPSYH